MRNALSRRDIFECCSRRDNRALAGCDTGRCQARPMWPPRTPDGQTQLNLSAFGRLSTRQIGTSKAMRHGRGQVVRTPARWAQFRWSRRSEGDEIPYLPTAAAKRKENFENSLKG